MATNEIVNDLEENNLIDASETRDGTSEKVEKVEEGRSTVYDLKGTIDFDRILEEARKNPIYNKMIGPCQKMGVKLNEKLLKYCESNIEKLANLEEFLNAAMPELIKNINKTDPHLSFDEEGNLDFDGIAEKIGDGPVPAYLEKYIADSDVEIKNFGQEFKLNDFTQNFWDNMTKYCSPRMKEILIDHKSLLDKWLETSTKDKNGNIMSVDTKVSKEENVARGMTFKGLDAANKLSDTSQERTMKERFGYGEQLLVFCLFADDKSKMEELNPETRAIIEELSEAMKEVLYERLGIKVGDDRSLEEFAKNVGKTLEQLKDYENSEHYREVVDSIDEIINKQITLEEIQQNREKQEFISIIGLIKESRLSNPEIISSSPILLKKASGHEKAADDFVEKNYPEYYENVAENKNIDEYSTFRFKAICELKAREILRKGIERNKRKKPEDKRVTKLDYESLKIAVAELKLKDTDAETKNLAFDFISRSIPEIKITPAIRQAIIEGNDEKKINEFLDTVQREAMFIVEQGGNENGILSGTDFAYNGILILEQMTRNGLYKQAERIGRHEPPEEGKNTLGFTAKQNAEYESLFDKKVSRYNERLYNTKYMGIVYKSIRKNAKVLDEKKEKLSPEAEIKFVKELILAAKMADKMGNDEIKISLSEYLVDFLPNAFTNSGRLKVEDLDAEFNKYLKDKGYADREDEINSRLESEINEAVQTEIKKTKIELDMANVLRTSEQTLHEEISSEKAFESIEDTIRFFNYIKRNTGSINQERKDELTTLAAAGIKKLEQKHDNIAMHVKLSKIQTITDHGTFDPNLEKDKFYYLAPQARRIVVNDRLNETKNRLDSGNVFDENDRMGAIGSYLAILNDYKNAELDTDIYINILGVAKELLGKMNPALIDENGEINNDKVLEEYNKLFVKEGEKEYTDFEEIVKIEEQQSLMRFGRRMAEEIEKGLLGSKDSRYLSLVTSDKLYVGAKINESLKKTVNLREEETTKLISEVWNTISNDREIDTEEEKVELVSNLALVYGMLKDATTKQPDKLSYEARKLNDLERKTFTLAQNKLMELFPSAFNGDVKIYGALEKEIKKYLCEHSPEIKERIESGEKLYKAIQEERSNRKQKDKSSKKDEKPKTVDELLEEVNGRLKSAKVEKTEDDRERSYELIHMVVDGIKDPAKKAETLKFLTKNFSEEEKARYHLWNGQSKITSLEKVYMRRVAGLSKIETYENRDKKIKMLSKKKGDTLLDVYAAIKVCEGMFLDDTINQDMIERAKNIIKELAPGVINSKGEISKSKLAAKINSYRGNDKFTSKIDPENMDEYAINRLNLKVARDYSGTYIDSRYNNDTYMPTFLRNDKVLKELKEKFVEIFSPEKVAQDFYESIGIKRYRNLAIHKFGTGPKHYRIALAEKKINQIEMDDVFEKLAVTISDENRINNDVEFKKVGFIDARKDKKADETIVKRTMPRQNIVNTDIQETYESKVTQSTESILRAEEINVGGKPQEENVVDEHPAVIEKKGLFRRAFEKVSEVVKNIKERFSGNGANNNSASDTATTSSNAGTDKKAEAAKTNELVQRVDVNVGLAQKAAAESQLNEKEEIDEGR